jgi:hypothetical protein
VAPAVQDVILLKDIGSAGGGPLLRLRKPFQTMVLLRVRQWRAGAMAVAERSGTSLYFLFFGGSFLQIYLELRCFSFFLMGFLCFLSNWIWI